MPVVSGHGAFMPLVLTSDTARQCLYFYNTPDDIAAMLQAIGVGSIDELFAMRARPNCG